MLTLVEIVGSMIAEAVIEVVERILVGTWRALRRLGAGTSGNESPDRGTGTTGDET